MTKCTCTSREDNHLGKVQVRRSHSLTLNRDEPRGDVEIVELLSVRVPREYCGGVHLSRTYIFAVSKHHQRDRRVAHFF